MAEKDWAAILKDEDRIIANSDRRFRYHCYSLESMSEELTYKEIWCFCFCKHHTR